MADGGGASEQQWFIVKLGSETTSSHVFLCHNWKGCINIKGRI